jgi:hypothetical protein
MQQKIKTKLKPVFYKLINFRHSIINQYSSKKGTDKSSKLDIVVNLTSYPKRIDKVYLTIETLLQQTLKPQRVVLWLSEQEIKPHQLPKTLLRQQKRGLEIRFVKENYKSYNKLIFALKEFPQSLLITADDDMYYPKWWVQKLYEAHLKTPDCIVCYRAHPILLKNTSQLLPYAQWVDTFYPSTSPTLDVFPTGVSGVLYFPGALDDEVFNTKAFQKLCPHGDDIWFKAMSLLKGVKCRKVFEKNILFRTIPNTQEDCLHVRNLYQNENDLPLEKVFDKYELYGVVDQNSKCVLK